MNKQIKLIAVDLDGTLLDDDHQLPQRTELALKKAISRGIHVVLATGKTRYASAPLIQQLGLTTPGVYSQGLIIANPDGTIRYQTNLADELAEEIAYTAKRHHISFVVYRDKEIYCTQNDGQTEIMVRYGEPPPIATGTIEALLGYSPFQKFIFVADPAKLARLKPMLSNQFENRVAMVFSNPNMLEFLPLGASKGGGLRRLLEDLAIEPEEVIAFGDADNDIEMIQLAGIGVAMGNAMPGPKAVADYITGTNNESGIAEALERFIFFQDPERTREEG